MTLTTGPTAARPPGRPAPTVCAQARTAHQSSIICYQQLHTFSPASPADAAAAALERTTTVSGGSVDSGNRDWRNPLYRGTPAQQQRITATAARQLRQRHARAPAQHHRQQLLQRCNNHRSAAAAAVVVDWRHQHRYNIQPFTVEILLPPHSALQLHSNSALLRRPPPPRLFVRARPPLTSTPCTRAASGARLVWRAPSPSFST